MPTVLYRKYRSQNFDELIGQDHISPILKNSVKKDSISHAYLFTGSRGTGKTSTARIFAKAVNCKKPLEGNPCNKCENCMAISDGKFLDLIEIDAASNRGIDQIRELKEKIEFSPVEGKFKIYIIDEVHMLTTEAFNALLKTLEEPPSHVIFILATTDAHKLPATIVSRCQRYDFRLGSNEEIASLIKGVAKKEKIKIGDEGIKILIENSKGSFRDALSLLDVVYSGQLESSKPDEISVYEIKDILGIPDSTMVYYLLEKIVQNDRISALELVEEIDASGVNLQQFVKYTLHMLEEILVKKMKGDLDEKEYSFANNLPVSSVIKLINAFLNVERNLRYASIPVLELEVLIGEMCEGDPDEIKETKVVEKKVVSKPKREEKIKQKEKKETISKGEDLTLKSIKDGWPKLTKKIQPANGHLFAFLGRVNLLSFDDGKLVLEVPFQFHKDRIEDPKSRDAISVVCEEVYGKTFCYECIVNSSIASKKPADPSVVLKIPEVKKEPVKVEKKSTKNAEEIFSNM